MVMTLVVKRADNLIGYFEGADLITKDEALQKDWAEVTGKTLSVLGPPDEIPKGGISVDVIKEVTFSAKTLPMYTFELAERGYDFDDVEEAQIRAYKQETATMPLPTPQVGESEEDFIGRCEKALATEYTDSEQRSAICYNQWRRKEE
jgi:hypothetical protein